MDLVPFSWRILKVEEKGQIGEVGKITCREVLPWLFFFFVAFLYFSFLWAFFFHFKSSGVLWSFSVIIYSAISLLNVHFTKHLIEFWDG